MWEQAASWVVVHGYLTSASHPSLDLARECKSSCTCAQLVGGGCKHLDALETLLRTRPQFATTLVSSDVVPAGVAVATRLYEHVPGARSTTRRAVVFGAVLSPHASLQSTAPAIVTAKVVPGEVVLRCSHAHHTARHLRTKLDKAGCEHVQLVRSQHAAEVATLLTEAAKAKPQPAHPSRVCTLRGGWMATRSLSAARGGRRLPEFVPPQATTTTANAEVLPAEYAASKFDRRRGGGTCGTAWHQRRAGRDCGDRRR